MRKLLILLAGSSVMCGCGEKCEGPPNAYETGVTLRLLRSADNSSLFLPGTGYYPDSLQLTDQNGQVLPLALPSFPRAAEVNFLLLQTSDRSALSQRLSRTYYLRFSATDQDTIQSEYELFNNDCNRPEFSTLKVFYNGRLLYEGGHSYGLEAIIYKP
ncbi:hypothetical protein [Hymenobacter aerophilus]|uniref:hypothetical protein n=1 Tax=Hymenobacter aerophilus TaxID=119644 RepID=UPI000475C8AA|nr:hypothetical protein [Hymenobacter aerophilus]